MNEPEETLENRIIDISVIDPVCGMAVNPVEARGKAQHEGQTYYFCSPACMHKFGLSPAKYLSAVHRQLRSKLRHQSAQPGSSTKIRFAEWMSMPRRRLLRWSTKASCITSAAAAARRNSKTILKNIFRPITRPAGMGAMVQIGGAPVQIGAARKLEKDVVCGMSVDPAKAASTAVHQGKTYYFCSRGCGEKFKADPEKYVSQSETPKITAVDAGGGAQDRGGCHREQRTCVRWIPRCVNRGPEPVPSAAWRWSPTSPWPRPGPSGPVQCIRRSFATGRVRVRSAAWRWSRRRSRRGQEENPELRDMTRRFWTSVLLGVPAGCLRNVAHGAAGARVHAAGRHMVRVRAGHANRAVVRLAFLRARLGVRQVPQSRTCSR